MLGPSRPIIYGCTLYADLGTEGNDTTVCSSEEVEFQASKLRIFAFLRIFLGELLSLSHPSWFLCQRIPKLRGSVSTALLYYTDNTHKPILKYI